MAAKVTLFTMPISHWCQSAERMLALKKVGYEAKRVPYHDKQELIATTKQDYVPALMWGKEFAPWYEIPELLEAKVPKPTLYPKGQKGLAMSLADWAHGTIEERVWRAVVTEMPAWFKDEKERWVFEEMQTRARGPWHVLESRKDEFSKDAAKYLSIVDEMLDGREFLLEEPSLADCAMWGAISPWVTAGRELPKGNRRLRLWWNRVGEW